MTPECLPQRGGANENTFGDIGNADITRVSITLVVRAPERKRCTTGSEKSLSFTDENTYFMLVSFPNHDLSLDLHDYQ